MHICTNIIVSIIRRRKFPQHVIMLDLRRVKTENLFWRLVSVKRTTRKCMQAHIIIIIMCTDVRLNKPLIALYDGRKVEQLVLQMFV